MQLTREYPAATVGIDLPAQVKSPLWGKIRRCWLGIVDYVVQSETHVSKYLVVLV